MDSRHTMLPSPWGLDSSFERVSLSNGDNAVSLPLESDKSSPLPSHDGGCPVQIIAGNGDFTLEYASPDIHSPVEARTVTHRWQVFSEDLIHSSPYFRALLDPNKFSEGRHFMSQKALQVETNSPDEDAPLHRQSALPTVRLPANHFSPRLGLDAIELFLKILSFNSLPEEEQSRFDAELRALRPSLVARLIELSDAFNSPQAVQTALRHAGFTLGKSKTPLTRFTSSMLKFSEDRIRQTIFIARFLGERTIFQILTHTLIIAGSKSWTNGLEPPPPHSIPFRWHYFPDGLEEELYYRRQSILNTITDLQAYFLRIYGALEEPTTTTSKPSIPNPSIAATAIQSRQHQCRCGLGNSSACDAFHLGQMTRFFALRTRTIFLGSTLIDPDFDPDGIVESDSEEEGDDYPQTQAHPQPQASGPRAPPTDITAVISSLKQCPDYQVDASHTGCGIRRRLLPPLDCIEGFVGDDRGLVGVKLLGPSSIAGGGSEAAAAAKGGRGGGQGEGKWPRIKGSWANRSLRRALVIDIRLARIGGIPLMTAGGTFGAGSREEDARLLFTAKKRNWEA